MTTEIRKIDTNHIIFLDGAQFASNFFVFKKPFDSKLVYSFHKYWTRTAYDVVAAYVIFSNIWNVPIWMGESGENSDEWITKFRTMLDKHEINWSFWTYKKMDSGSCVVKFSSPERWD